MLRLTNPRWRAPAVMLAGGTVIDVAVGIGHGWHWGAEIILALLTILAAAGYYLLGGRDTDTGAIYSGHMDERQLLIWTQAMALSGWVVSLALLVAFVIALVLGKPTWPFALVLGIGVVTFFGATAVYRRREAR